MNAQIKVKVQRKAIVRMKMLPRFGATGVVWRGIWSSAVTYAPGDSVEYNNSSYISKTANINKPPAASPVDWDLMVAQGATGSVGASGPPGLIWRGNWSSSTIYIVNDGVAYNGASYICVIGHAATATPPLTANWNLLAQAGTAAIADSQIDPVKLNSDNTTEQHLFRDRLNFVARDGDNMTGTLVINTSSAPLTMRKGTTTQDLDISATSFANTPRWTLRMGSQDTESGGSVGSNFDLYGWRDDGLAFKKALSVSRADGLMTLFGDPTAALHTATKQYVDSRATSISVKSFGATGNGVRYTGNCTIALGSAALTVTGASFTVADVGKLIVVPGAGVASYPLNATISGFTSATQVTLSVTASTALVAASKQIVYGTNDGPAINAAIASLPSTGGTVTIPAGVYCTDVSIAIGNGTSSGASTQQGVKLKGTGYQSQLVWAGSTGGGPVVAVNGQISDFAVNGLTIDGSNLAYYGLKIVSGNNGETWQLLIQNCLIAHYNTGTWTGINSDQIIGGNIIISMNALTSSGTGYGFLFDGAADGSSSSCFITLTNLRIYPVSSVVQHPVYFRICDTITLNDVLVFYTSPPNVSSSGVMYDYTGNPTFPCGNKLEGIDAGWQLPAAQQFQSVGSAASAGSANLINSLTELNGCRYPTTIPNVTLDIPRKITVDIDIVNRTTSIASGSWYVPKFATLYRINYVVICRTAGGAGTFNLLFSYQDTAGNARNLAVPTLAATAAGGSQTGSLVLSLTNYLFYQLDIVGPSGSPAFDLHMMLERLN